MEEVTLQVVARVEIRGQRPGEIFSVPGRDGEVWDPFWQKRFREGSVVSVAPIKVDPRSASRRLKRQI
jgi:hypothetical protein